MLNHDEIECDLDDDIDDEHYTSKTINDSYVNKLGNFSLLNPSVSSKELLRLRNGNNYNHSVLIPSLNNPDNHQALGY